MNDSRTLDLLFMTIALSCATVLGAEHKAGSQFQSDLRQLLTFRALVCGQTSSLKLSQPTRNATYATGQEAYTIAQQKYEAWLRSLMSKPVQYRAVFAAALEAERAAAHLLALHARTYREETEVNPPFVVFTAAFLDADLKGKDRERILAMLRSNVVLWPTWAELR